MIYGSLSSTWSVNTGVLVHDGVAYFGEGIVDHDGTYLYAVDATTGRMIWQNNTSGHLNPELRKGVSVQGNLTILDNTLVLAGGNVVSPARFELNSGQCLESPREQGQPQANGGRFMTSGKGRKESGPTSRYPAALRPLFNKANVFNRPAPVDGT